MYTARHAIAAAAVLALLAACGGGNDDDPSPTDKDALFTVTDATSSALNGAYGTLNISLTDIEKRNPVGSTPETCSYRFDNVSRIGPSDTKAFGDVRFLPNTNDLFVTYLTIDGREYNSSTAVDSSVRRDESRVTFSNKLFAASNDAAQTIRVSGFIPMRRDRVPFGC